MSELFLAFSYLYPVHFDLAKLLLTCPFVCLPIYFLSVPLALSPTRAVILFTVPAECMAQGGTLNKIMNH